MTDDAGDGSATPPKTPPQTPPQTPIWPTQGLETLVGRFPQIDPDTARANPTRCDVDLVIVGSGYGAAVAAHEFAGCRPAGQPGAPALSICILERGDEYPRGAFPSRLADLAGHVRFSSEAQAAPRGRRNGLFDLRLGGDVVALLANGVGGGSLINAGVMLEPHPQVWQGPRWPQALRTGPGLTAHFDAVRPWLGAGTSTSPNSVDNTALAGLHKTAVLRRLGGQASQAVPITVALKPGTQTVAGVPLEACIGCGDCATGCNHGAKISLDIGLLAQARQTEGVALYSGATVLWVEQLADAAGWAVWLQHTDDKLRLRQGRPFRLLAKRVVLAAGSLGSTEILLRSRQHGLALSSLLGQRFSTNGDLIASLHGLKPLVNAAADEDRPADQRQVGPTITAMVDQRSGGGGFVVQDLAVPGPLRQAFAEFFTTAQVLHALPEADCQPHHAQDRDGCAVDDAVIGRSLPVAMIGHDDACGRLELVTAHTGASPPAPGSASEGGSAAEGDGALRIVWPGLKDDPRWTAQHAALTGLLDRSEQGGRVLPNPVWQLLPATLQASLNIPHGPTLTVHPLGGCAMGDDWRSAVVDDLGRVFAPPAPTGQPSPAHHNGLVVLDGAIVPSSLGVNPALTIAALTHRAAQGLRQAWALGPPQPKLAPAGPRPVFRAVAPSQPAAPAQPTRIELMERLRGTARLADGSLAWVELTLYSQATELRRLMQPAPDRTLVLDACRSRLRVFVGEPTAWADEPQPGQVLLNAGLAGSLTIFQHEPAGRLRRAWRTAGAFGAWVVNRGWRDFVQNIDDWVHGRPSTWALQGLLALAGRAGAVRRLDYRLSTHGAQGPLACWVPDGTPLAGVKRLHYGLATSPLQQLMDMRLTQCPGLARGEAPLLSLHLPFLAIQAVPLMRVVGQQDQPSALADSAAFLAYVVRILIDGQLWAFRKPDAASPRLPQRLPGRVDKAPEPQVTEIEVARLAPSDSPRRASRASDTSDTGAEGASGLPVHLRLTRYCPANVDSSLPPVLMIHGYSASGTTFAHPTLKPGLMAYLTGAHRRDVWLLDLRSSCGMPSAEHGWAFEDMGCEDIPVAVAQVCAATGFEQIDIVAHCMGVAMLCMGLLGQNSFDSTTHEPLLPRLGRFERLRHQLWDRDLTYWRGENMNDTQQQGAMPQPRSRIRRLVMSQVGPALLLFPANIARSYLMRYAQQFLRGRPYRFKQDGDPGLADQLLDRLLAAMPYPPGEFGRENPFRLFGQRVPWVGSRHRIDALFGRVFNLANMADDTLAHIDDFFGPFSVDSVSQVMHFARYRMITDRSGFNRFVNPDRLQQRLRFPMLSLHARQNGLADPATQHLMQTVIGPNLGPGGSLLSEMLPGNTLGHQDSLIGHAAATAPVLQRISDFLQQA